MFELFHCFYSLVDIIYHERTIHIKLKLEYYYSNNLSYTLKGLKYIINYV